MRWSYFCPHCGAGLNPDETIILVGEHADHRVLVGLHPQPGDYQAYLPPGIDAGPGSRWRFSCPVCHTDLATKVSNGLCAIDGLYDGEKHQVYFSPVAGEEVTFLVSAEGTVEQHGRDTGKHSLDLLGDV